MKISIITINFNNAKGLAKTIASVSRQSCHSFEYIVIDGGSTDDSLNVIKQNSEHITRWVSEPDKGIFNAMNKGISYASGEYMIFMNSGDAFYDEDVIEMVLPYLKGKHFYVGGQISLYKRPKTIWPPKTLTAYHLFNGFLSHQATFIWGDLLRKRPYREDLRIASDWEQMLYELVFNNCSYEALPVMVACFDTTGVSHQKNNNALLDKERDEVCRELFPPRVYADYKLKDIYMDKILYAYHVKTPLAGDFKMIRNIFKKIIFDIFHRC